MPLGLFGPLGTAVVVVLGIVALLLAMLRLKEGSTRGAKRELESWTRKVVASIGFVVVGLVASATTALDAGADAFGAVFAELAAFPGILANLSLGGLAVGVASGMVDYPATTIAAVAGGIILLFVGVSRS